MDKPAPSNPTTLRRALILVFAFSFAIVVYFALLDEGRPVAGAMAIAVLAATLWITEVLPLAVTALLIPVGLSSVSVFEVTDAFHSFGNPVLFLVLGGYGLAAAVGANQVDQWLAHRMLRKAGDRSLAVAATLMATAAVLSMLVSNSATTALLLSVGVGIVEGQRRDPNLARLLPLAIAYGASIGGVATLIGSPPNAIAAGLLDIGFGQWMAFAAPVSIVMLLVAFPILWFTYRPSHDRIQIDLGDPPGLSARAVRTIVILAATVLLWLLGPTVGASLGLSTGTFSAASIACAAVAVLVLTRCVGWDDLEHRVQWGVLLLLGGGLSLGRGLTESGAADWLAGLLVTYTAGLPAFAVLTILVAIGVFATELISNTAVTAKLAPILIGVAIQFGLAAETLVVPVAIATSMAFMLPVATPPNAMVHASGHVSQGDMIRVGFRLNLAAIVVISLIFA